MAYAFYLLGWVGIFAGGWLVATAYRASQQGLLAADQYAQAGATLGFLAVATPGFAILLAGLIVLGIGGGLARLDAIARNSRQSAKILREGFNQQPR